MQSDVGWCELLGSWHPPHTQQLDAMQVWLAHGPTSAHVDHVELCPAPEQMPPPGFTII